MFGEGISKAGEILDLGVDYGVIDKSGSWFSYNGSKLAQGRDAAKQVIQDNPELAEELEKQIMEALRESDAAPKGKAAGKAVKPATKKEAAPAEDDEKKEDLFDDTIGDDFSIEEDL